MGEQRGWERKILCEILRKVTKVSFKKDITEVIGGLTSISRRRISNLKGWSLETVQMRAGVVTGWWSANLAWTRSWVQSLAKQTQNQNKQTTPRWLYISILQQSWRRGISSQHKLAQCSENPWPAGIFAGPGVLTWCLKIAEEMTASGVLTSWGP